MFLGTLFALCLISVPLAGGRLGALGELHLRGNLLIGVALGTQIVIISVVPGGSQALHQDVHLATYGLAATYAWINRRVPGLPLAAAGGACNLAAIAANGGVMPASAAALRYAGLGGDADAFQNSASVPGAHLPWLGDVFALPASWPVHNVFSVGDVVLVLGVLAGLHILCGTRPARRLRAYPVTVTGVVRVPTQTSRLLIRVATVAHRGMAPGALLVDDGATVDRFEPLPGSGAVAGFAVPAAVLSRAQTRLALSMPNGATQALSGRKARGGRRSFRRAALAPMNGTPS